MELEKHWPCIYGAGNKYDILNDGITPDKQAKYLTQQVIGQVLCLEHCFIWLRDLDTNKFVAEVFGQF